MTKKKTLNKKKLTLVALIGLVIILLLGLLLGHIFKSKAKPTVNANQNQYYLVNNLSQDATLFMQYPGFSQDIESQIKNNQDVTAYHPVYGFSLGLDFENPMDHCDIEINQTGKQTTISFTDLSLLENEIISYSNENQFETYCTQYLTEKTSGLILPKKIADALGIQTITDDLTLTCDFYVPAASALLDQGLVDHIYDHYNMTFAIKGILQEDYQDLLTPFAYLDLATMQEIAKNSSDTYYLRDDEIAYQPSVYQIFSQPNKSKALKKYFSELSATNDIIYPLKDKEQKQNEKK